MARRKLGEVGPFVKWAGGKGQLLAAYDPLLPQSFGTYFEPFVGGGALFFHLAGQRRISRAVLSDRNPDLVNAYTVVRDHPEELVRELARSRYQNDEEAFYRIRAEEPERLGAVRRAARLIYLNRTAFNGLYRLNSSGRFNVPFGRYRNPAICDPPRLRLASAALQRAAIHGEPFEVGLARVRAGDLVYLDPPYVPVSSTASFTAYDRHGFGPDDQARLASAFEALDARGARALLSNSDTPLVRKLYAGFPIVEVAARRNINSVGTSRGRVAEVVVLGHTLARALSIPEAPRATRPARANAPSRSR